MNEFSFASDGSTGLTFHTRHTLKLLYEDMDITGVSYYQKEQKDIEIDLKQVLSDISTLKNQVKDLEAYIDEIECRPPNGKHFLEMQKKAQKDGFNP